MPGTTPRRYDVRRTTCWYYYWHIWYSPPPQRRSTCEWTAEPPLWWYDDIITDVAAARHADWFLTSAATFADTICDDWWYDTIFLFHFRALLPWYMPFILYFLHFSSFLHFSFFFILLLLYILNTWLSFDILYVIFLLFIINNSHIFIVIIHCYYFHAFHYYFRFICHYYNTTHIGYFSYFFADADADAKRADTILRYADNIISLPISCTFIIIITYDIPHAIITIAEAFFANTNIRWISRRLKTHQNTTTFHDILLRYRDITTFTYFLNIFHSHYDTIIISRHYCHNARCCVTWQCVCVLQFAPCLSTPVGNGWM